MQRAQSAAESFFRQTVSTSMALGSLVGGKLDKKEDRGRPFPFLRAKMQAFSIQTLRVVGTFSME